MPRRSKNIKGYPLEVCGQNPMTGFYRDGYCHTGPNDVGTHTVCARMTDDFLQYTKKKGNNLSDPSPGNQFPGLKRGDKWCLCAQRWKQANKAGKAPPVDLDATNQVTLRYIKPQALRNKNMRK